MFIDNENIPVQKIGSQSYMIEHVRLENESDAEELYHIAKLRLLNMWNWSNIVNGASAEFELTDKEGNPVNRPAQRGDKFKIDLYTSKYLLGSQTDWVVIAHIDEECDPFEDTAITSIKVRPTCDPKSNQKEIAHFFTPQASSTFVVRRIGKVVSVEIHGRNETANLKTANFLETIRHCIAAVASKVGFSKSEWRHLAEGLLGARNNSYS